MSRVLVSLAVGDTNLTSADLEELAAAAGAVYVEGHGIDSALLRGPADVLAVDELAKGGSDHHPILYTLRIGGRLVRVLAWNVYVGQKPWRVRRRLRRLIGRYRPDVIALSEAYRCRAVLAALADRAGYVHLQGPNRGEGADCALLTRVDHEVLHDGVARMRQPWTGPKHGEPKQPREYPYARLLLGRDVVLRVMAIHPPTGGPTSRRNGAAVRETTARLAHWIQRGHQAPLPHNHR